MKQRAPVFSLHEYRERRMRAERGESDPDWHPAPASFPRPGKDNGSKGGECIPLSRTRRRQKWPDDGEPA